MGSIRGNSSHNHNPFRILKRPTADEFQGEAIGFSLIYSGNFLAQVEVDTYDTARVLPVSYTHLDVYKRQGLEIICFTDHFDKDDMEWGEESIFDPEMYFRTLRPLQEKYRDQIDVRIGVELGLRPYLGDYYREFVSRYPFDFVIGSVHSVDSSDPATGKLFASQTDAEAYRQAFAETLEDIRAFQDFDAVSYTHRDVYKRQDLRHGGKEHGG